MLLDRDELDQKDLLEEKTINKFKNLMTLWIIAGFLGLMISISFLYMELDRPISYNSNKRFYFRFIFISAGFIFGILGALGIKYRMNLNNSLDKANMIKIPNFEIYFWIMISGLCCLFWYMVENNLL